MATETKQTRFETLGLGAPLNEVLRVIGSHTSCRSYKPDPLPPGTLEHLITAAQSTSTSSNLQAYSIVAIEDPERKERLSRLCGNQKFIAQSPLFLAFCPDKYRLEYLCKRQGRPFGATFLEMFLLASMDAALAAQSVALAAESMGLGICMVGAIRNNEQEVMDLLGLPQGVYALTGMCIGFPDRTYPTVKPRLPMKAVLHREAYSVEHLEEALCEYDETMAASGIYEGRQVEMPDEPATLDGRIYGWAEHTSRRVSRPETLSEAASLRKNLRKTLVEHGWTFA
jgi:FMN reductase [NAD(P)H]